MNNQVGLRVILSGFLCFMMLFTSLSGSTGQAFAYNDSFAPASLVVETRSSDLQSGDNQITPIFNIKNLGRESVPLDQLSIRYWYTKEDDRTQVFKCDWAAIGCNHVTSHFGNIAGVKADTYVEISFTQSSYQLAAGSETGEILTRINKTDWSLYDETNDYSFRPESTTLVAWDKVTLYRNGMLIWGVEPQQLTTPDHQFSMEYRAINGNTEDNEIAAAFDIRNEGTTEVPTTDIRIPILAAGENHTLEIRSDGSVWSWGANRYGQLGDGTTKDSYNPVQVKDLSNVVEVSGGRNHSVALKQDGTVWAWGENYYGQLGDGTTTSSSMPVQVKGLSNVIAISAAYDHSIALKQDGTVWIWGKRLLTNVKDVIPVKVDELSNVTNIYAGDDNIFVIKQDHTAWAWGRNSLGQLGDGTSIDRATPVSIRGLSDIKMISVGISHSVALKQDGTIWAWGNGQASTPKKVIGLSNVKAIATGSRHSFAVEQDGTVWAWGSNIFGQFGNDTASFSSTPVQVTGLSNVTAIIAGSNHSFAVKQDGTVWAWGLNNNGQLGDGSAGFMKSVPVQVVALSDVVSIAAGWVHSVAVKGDGTVWKWGQDWGTLTGKLMTNPVQVSGLSNVIAVSVGTHHSIALKQDGTVWAWGDNFNAQSGDGTSETKENPVQVSGLSNVVAISAKGMHSIALKQDGTVWRWGRQWSDDGLFPVQVSELSNVIAIAAGESHSLVVKEDGSVWAWGDNRSGQLGDGTRDVRKNPVQVIGLSNVIAVSAGSNDSIALKQDGTVWVWGYHNFNKQREDGTTHDLRIPMQVSELSNVKAIAGGGSSHSIVAKQDGTAWASGSDGLGALGDGDVIGRRDTLVQVSGMTNVREIAAGGSHSFAVKQDGTLWSWGFNASGQLGDGSLYAFRPIKIIPLQNKFTYIYDNTGKVDYIIMKHSGEKIDYQYDKNGNLIKKVKLQK